MQPLGKFVVARQDYPPDTSTTAANVAEIACRLAAEHEVVVLSGWPGKQRWSDARCRSCCSPRARFSH
ncbi:hypothetical protein [Bradyrhizobium sp. CCBAU 45384]|uniref:hypothetical protein n=1 Tax=Bradyrhizobium sp. CCBAU 45384 TaxID=858428 RepID=UPI0023061247|nr:hypothetical protein [Bradyrhizobium sp. CCBAU 45384]